MPSAASDRALKRLVADLATHRSEDVEAVLDQLDDGQRERVKALLASYLGGPEPPTDPEPVKARRKIDYSKIEGLSPWLVTRLRLSQGDVEAPRKAAWLPRRDPPYDREVRSIKMTPAALNELHKCAETLFAAEWGELETASPWGQALVSRIRDVLTGARTPS